jgi:CDP-diacylglycerol---glycerol-3-phosphate 3-phosphatidyltransferase
LANLITIARVAVLFVGIGMLSRTDFASLVLAAFVALAVVAADGLDGWVARKRGETSRFGAVLDIVGDRVVEAAYLVTFAAMGLIPLWIPLLVLTRGFLVDGVRGLALERGQTAFGPNTMMVSRLGRALTSSRPSRAVYGAMKCALFVVFPLVLAVGQLDAPPALATLREPLVVLGLVLAYAVAAFCLIRGLLVIHDALPLIRHEGSTR